MEMCTRGLGSSTALLKVFFQRFIRHHGVINCAVMYKYASIICISWRGKGVCMLFVTTSKCSVFALQPGVYIMLGVVFTYDMFPSGCCSKEVLTCLVSGRA